MHLKNRFHRQHIMIGERSRIDKSSVIGAYTYIGTDCSITKATIGRYVSIGNHVVIGPGEHNIQRISTSAWLYQDEVGWYQELTEKDIWIGNDVWVGTGAVIRRGVTVGDGAVIGANSFVNCQVPDFAVVGGYRPGLSNIVLMRRQGNV